MMQSQNCKCPHHGFTKLLRVLALVAGVLFFWTLWRGSMVLGLDAMAYMYQFIVLVLAILSMRGGCKCCCGEKHCDTCGVKPM